MTSPTDAPLAAQLDEWLVEIRRHAREQMHQGHLSPGENAWMGRLMLFLDGPVRQGVADMSSPPVPPSTR